MLESTRSKAEWKKCRKKGRIGTSPCGRSYKGIWEKNTGRRSFFGSKNQDFSGSKKVIKIQNSSMRIQCKEERGTACIERLINDQGQECRTHDQLVEEITRSYQKLFTISKPTNWEDSLEGLPQSINTSMNQRLVRPMDELEIKKALFAMSANKSPGPDGMTPHFFQKCWHIVEHDVCVAV